MDSTPQLLKDSRERIVEVLLVSIRLPNRDLQ